MKSNANTIKGLFLSYIQRAKKLGNIDFQIVLEEMLLEVERIMKTEKDEPFEIEIISGWKGTGDLTIYKGVTNDFICVEHIKDKTTEKIEERRIEIKKEDVNNILKIINKLNVGDKISCYNISKELGWASWKDLWRERKIYFKTYYYCLKILEKLKIIEYGARSTKRLI